MAGKKGRRLFYALAVFMAALLAVGCGRSNSVENETSKAKIDPEVVFREIELPSNIFGENAAAGASGESAGEMGPENIQKIMAVNDRYYVMYADSTEEGRSFYLCSFDEAGENVKTLRIPSSEDGWISACDVSEDESIVILENSYNLVADTTEWVLCCYSFSGGVEQMTESWKQVLKGDDDFYVQGIVCHSQYTLLLLEEEIRIHSVEDGKELKRAELPSKQFYGGICINEKKEIILAGSGAGTGGVSAWKLNPETAVFTKASIQSEGYYGFGSIAGGNGGYDFYNARGEGIFGFRIDGTEPVKIVDFVASDLELQSVLGCALLSPDSAMITSYTSEGKQEVLLLKKADPSTIGDRTLLTLGCSYMDTGLRKAVVNFNKSNEKYRIEVKEYRYDNDGNNNLNQELAAGNIPDLICVTEDMPMESYADKGVFEDLESRFLSDPEISQIDFFDNVLEAYRIDGKMYFVTPDVNIVGMVGKRKDFGERKSVKISDLEQMIAEREIAYETALGVTNREQILQMVMFYATEQYVDWKEKTCSFDTESFISLLEFTKKFPVKINYDNIDWDEEEANMLEGKQILRNAYLYNFDSYMYERYGYIGEELSFMGYPGNGESGPALQTSMIVAMSHAGTEKDACWEFLRTLYLDEYQNALEFGFPVSREVYLANAEKAMQPQTYTYTDENGKKITEDIEKEIFLNGKGVKIPDPQQKDIDEITHIIENTRSKVMIDSNISKIINEETGAFYEGQKSAEETADVIQSRVWVYISEVK